jgi:hypothetical protein
VAEDTEKSEKTAPAPGAKQLKAAREFVAEHGDPSKGVVEYLGRRGARVVLVGADGAMGDVVVSGVQTGTALVEAVDGLELAEWDSATVNATVIGAAHRRKMAGPRARR